ncbi:hypothetical protein TNCV_2604861 [Trichonephila clavipes]|nr:hypothetical protein TNCV_2604861 [Trichonephila clavipes]
MVSKKGTFDWRPVGDYRALNAQTIKDKYPIPCLADFTANLHGSKVFSQVDLVKAYHQIPMNPDDIHKTTICTPFGLFESTRMQFGLCGASAIFQRFIDEVTRNLEGVYAFVDNILIASRDPEEHHKHLKALFSRLHEYGLKLKPCQISDHNLICDTSTGTPRPFVPTTFRKLIFEHLHNLSHPGIAATTKLICSRYVWPCMKKQIKTWVRGCDKCQRSKVQRHTKSPLGTFSTPDARFSHIHIDIVGPLPPSDGFQYLLTMIDRFSRWPEAVPIP